MNPALSLRHVTVRFGQRTVLDNVNLSVQPREVVAILGASGSGKTTLLRIIAGILSPQSGRVFWGVKTPPRGPPSGATSATCFKITRWAAP